MPIFDDELIYAEFLRRDVQRRRQELDELWSAYPNRRQGLEPFTITSVGTAAPSPAPLDFLSSTASSATPPPPTLAAPTSIDTISEPLQGPPARCSTEGHSHDEHAQVLVAAAPTSATTLTVKGAEEEVFATEPTRCSMTCLSQDSMLNSENSLNICCSLEKVQHRYITNFTSTSLFDVRLPPRVLGIQIVHDRMGVQKSVFAALVVKGPKPYILHFDTIDISPKPPWPTDSAKGNFNPQLGFNFLLWFACDWIAGQLRQPWPPPKQPQLPCVGIQLRPTPWPSFDFLTSVHLEKALLSSWHSFQFVKLSLWDGRLLQFATEAFLLVAQLPISIQVGLVIGTTKVQALGCSSHRRAGIAEFFMCQCELTVARISSQRNGLQYLRILAQLQQHLNYQSVIMWDPGDDQHFVGGCKSLDYWLNLELRQIIWYCVEKSQNLYLQFLKHKIYQYLAISNKRSPSVHLSAAWSDVDHRRPDNGGRILNLAWFSSKQVLICVAVSPDFQNNVIFSHQWVNGLSNSWHTVKLVNLHEDDSRLLYLPTYSFQLVLHLLFRLPVVCRKSPTYTLLVGYCPLNVQFTISWVSFCGLEYAVPCLMFSQCQYHQIVSALKYLQGNGITSGFCQLIIQSNSSAIECWQSSQKMHHSVAWLFSVLYFVNDRRTLSLIIPLKQRYSLVLQIGGYVVLILLLFSWHLVISLQVWEYHSTGKADGAASSNYKSCRNRSDGNVMCALHHWKCFLFQVILSSSRKRGIPITVCLSILHSFSFAVEMKLHGTTSVLRLPTKWDCSSNGKTSIAKSLICIFEILWLKLLHMWKYESAILVLQFIGQISPTKPTIVNDMPQYQKFAFLESMPQFTQTLLIGQHERGSISNGRTGITKVVVDKISGKWYVLWSSPSLVQFLYKQPFGQYHIFPSRWSCFHDGDELDQTTAPSNVMSHTMVFWFKQMQKSNQSASTWLDEWLSTPCCSLVLQMRNVLLKPVNWDCMTAIVGDTIQAQLGRGEMLWTPSYFNFKIATAAMSFVISCGKICAIMAMICSMAISLYQVLNKSHNYTTICYWIEEFVHHSTSRHSILVMLSPFAPGLQPQKLLLGGLQQILAFRYAWAASSTELPKVQQKLSPYDSGHLTLQFYALVIEDP